jgi:hypothetical protein
MILHIMVGQNPKKWKAKETTIFKFSYEVMLTYIYTKTNCYNVLENENIFKKWLKWFLIFMKVVNIMSPYDWNRFVNHLKSLIIITNGFFLGQWS